MENDQIASDDLEGRFKRRVFLSFARTSLAISKRIESELIRAQFGVERLRRCFRRDQHLVGGGLKAGLKWLRSSPNVGSAGARGISLGVDPWRYEPGDPQGPDTRQSDNFVAQMERFEQDHPGIMERLEATLRRCVAYVFVVSNASICSAACNVEAFVVACRFRQNRQKSPVWVVLEEAGLEPTHLSAFRTILYEAGVEAELAGCIAYEIEALGLDYPSKFIL